MKVLVAIGGHDFDRSAFKALLASLPNTTYEIVKHPEAAERMNPRAIRDVDALLLYDVPGLDFRDSLDPPQALEPSAAFTDGFEALLARGVGIVALHHALAGWPAWPRYADILGGAFLYRPREVRGVACPDSGYASDVQYRAQVLRTDHPIVAGLPTSFMLRDELYLGEIFASDIVQLLSAEHRVEPQHFTSAAAAVRGRPAPATPRVPTPGSNTIAWAQDVGRSRVAYLQPGDSAQTLLDPHYQRLVANALRWAIS